MLGWDLVSGGLFLRPEQFCFCTDVESVSKVVPPASNLDESLWLFSVVYYPGPLSAIPCSMLSAVHQSLSCDGCAGAVPGPSLDPSEDGRSGPMQARPLHPAS